MNTQELLEQKLLERDAEITRHTQALNGLDSTITNLRAAGSRTRRAALNDHGTADEVVNTLLEAGGPLSLPELRAALGRPVTAELRSAVESVVTAAEQLADLRTSDRAEDRFATIVDALLDIDQWPAAIRIRALRMGPLAASQLAERARADADTALLIGMHLGQRTWGKSTRPAAALRWLQDNPWVNLGLRCDVGTINDPQIERDLRDQLRTVHDPALALRVAREGVPARTKKGISGLRAQVETIVMLTAQLQAAQPAADFSAPAAARYVA